MERKDREKLIAFLEEEAEVLRHRVAGLSQRRRYPGGVTTGESDPGPAQVAEAENKARLREVESQLRDLKRQVG
jgi:hypothetical protein